MNQDTREAIIDHAQNEFPKEACGLVVNIRGHERYMPCRNLAQNQTDFIMDPEDYARAEDAGDIIRVVHSHPNASPKPSQADRVACEASGLPWSIVSMPGLSWADLEPSGYKAPLVGRSFCHGVLDCYSLIRDWYQQERGVTLLDFDRREEWWKKGEDMYFENFQKAGFYKIDSKDVASGDVILMQVQSKVINHGGIYLGNNVILHHVIGRLSTREIYGGYWAKVTRMIIRYGGQS